MATFTSSRKAVKRNASPRNRQADSSVGVTGYRFAPTTPGGFFFLLMVLIMGAAVASGHNLLYLVVCLFFGTFIVMGNAAVTNLKGLRFERETPEHVHARTPQLVEIRVSNPRRLMDSFALEIHETSGSNGKPDGKVFLPLVEKGRDATSSYTLDLPTRGWHDFRGLEIMTRFPFGFWERSRRVSLPERLLVFPKVFRKWPEGMSHLTVDGEFVGDRSGMGDELLNFREYQPGDPIRWIHWKNTAKTDRLTVAIYHHPKNRNVVVCLRTTYQNRRDGTIETHFEEAVSWAATAVCQLLDKGVCVGYLDETARIPVAFGEGQKLRILTHLALVPLNWSREERVLPFDSVAVQAQETMIIEASETGVRIETGSGKHHFAETGRG